MTALLVASAPVIMVRFLDKFRSNVINDAAHAQFVPIFYHHSPESVKVVSKLGALSVSVSIVFVIAQLLNQKVAHLVLSHPRVFASAILFAFQTFT
jgi:hypothetical protein